MFTSPWQKPFRGMQINKAHPLARGLVGAWVLNEATGDKVFDLSGNSNHGTNNGADWVSNGLDFDGSDYINCGNGATLQPVNAITIVTKVQIDSIGPVNSLVYKQTTGATRDGYNFDIRSAGPTVDFWLPNAAAWNGVSTSITTGSYVIVATYDRSYSRLYIDGIEKASAPYTHAITTNTQVLQIGGRGIETANYFDGTNEYVYIYNRALSAEEVAWLNREPYAMFEQPISPASLYYEAGAPTLGIPIAMYHYQHH